MSFYRNIACVNRSSDESLNVYFLLFQWMAEVNQIVSDDPALAPLLQTFPEPYPQDSPELIEVRNRGNIHKTFYAKFLKSS
jgi:hypothetical protein